MLPLYLLGMHDGMFPFSHCASFSLLSIILTIICLPHIQVKVTPKHNEESKRLLTLMGMPYVEVYTNTLYMCALFISKYVDGMVTVT